MKDEINWKFWPKIKFAKGDKEKNRKKMWLHWIQKFICSYGSKWQNIFECNIVYLHDVEQSIVVLHTCKFGDNNTETFSKPERKRKIHS